MTDAERFWSKVDIRGENDCWEWKANRTKLGYGTFWVNGKNVRAHRYALSQTEIPPEGGSLLALHCCDNPPCCNPRHLRWGTTMDNIKDRLERRGPWHGEGSPTATITDEIADQILQGRMNGKNINALSQELGLPRTLVENVYVGSSWKHRHGVDGNPTLEELKSVRPKRGTPAPNRVLSEEMIDRIFQGRMEGMSCQSIANELGLPVGTVSPVYSGVAFTDRLGKNGNPTFEELRSVKAPNPLHKLTEDDTLEIQNLLDEGYTGTSIAKLFGVSKATITRVKKLPR